MGEGKRWVSRETRAAVSRETPLGHLPAPPARRLHHEIVQITRGHARDPRRLRQRRRPYDVELLPRLRRETRQLKVGQVPRQPERRKLRQAPRCLPLACEIPLVLELDLRRPHHVAFHLLNRPRRRQQLPQRCTRSLHHGRHALRLYQLRSRRRKRARRLCGGDRRVACGRQHLLLLAEPPLRHTQLARCEQAQRLGKGQQPPERVVLAQQEPELRAGREQSIRLVPAPRHHVVPQEPHVGGLPAPYHPPPPPR